jgi:outer membrane murein-binding lipoprotein Lpp
LAFIRASVRFGRYDENRGGALTLPEAPRTVSRAVGSLQYKNKMLRVLATIGVFLLAGCVTAPPVQEMSDARQAIAAAEEADAERVASDTLAAARRFLAEAERQIQEEAYGPARMNAVRAKNRALLALRSTEVRDAADD